MYIYLHVVTFTCRCFEVTLKDFRSAIGKSSSHKFFFKSLDPDIGAVKEEVSIPIVVLKIVR